MSSIIVLALLQISLAFATNLTTTDEVLIFKGHSRGRRAVLVNNDPSEPCRIYGHKYSNFPFLAIKNTVGGTYFVSSNPIQVIENLPEGQTLRTINQQEWLLVAAECQQRLLSFNQKPATPSHQLDFIYPGTKWCGTGDVAGSFDDLGSHVATDICCRNHDFCQDTMKPGTCKYGLCNTSVFTKSHCDCDDQFRQCLLNTANDPASIPVGFLYFDVGAISCYRQSPDCINGVFKEPIELTRRRKRQHQAGRTELQYGWCFVPPQPFKKSAIFRQNQPDGMFRRVFSSMGDVKTMVKHVTGSSLSVRAGK